MTRATPAQVDLAGRLLAHEAAGRQDLEDLIAAAEGVCGKLHARIALVLGGAGFHALAARALQLASAEFAFLGGVEVKLGSSCSLQGLRERAAGLGSGEVGDGLVAAFASFLWLLDSFIGQGLARLFVGEAFPEVVHGHTTAGSGEADKGEDRQ